MCVYMREEWSIETIYVDDVCRAIKFLMEHGEENEIYNVSTGHPMYYYDIISMVKDAIPGCTSEITSMETPEFYSKNQPKNFYLNCEKANSIRFQTKHFTTDWNREIMYQLIEKFIQDAKEMDDNIFPFMGINKDWKPGKSVYYSGPYWDDLEAQELIYGVMKGKWLSSGEKVNRFEHEFSQRFGFEHSVMVNSGSSS